MIWLAAAAVVIALIVAVTVTLHKSMNMQHALNLKRAANSALDDREMAELTRQLQTNEATLAIETAKADRAAYEYGLGQARLASQAIEHLKHLDDERQKELIRALTRQFDGAAPPWKMKEVDK